MSEGDGANGELDGVTVMSDFVIGREAWASGSVDEREAAWYYGIGRVYGSGS